MRIGATSDMHGHLPDVPKGLDLLLVAGDIGPATHQYHRDFQFAEHWLTTKYADWLAHAGCPVVGVAGNHDYIAQAKPELMRSLPWKYLCDSGEEFYGLKFWGSPWTPKFGPWAFMKKDSELGQYWTQIPEDTQVLITHGPARGFGDQVTGGERVGSPGLGIYLSGLLQLKLHVFGHIHEEAGFFEEREANVSRVDENYDPVHPVWEFTI